MDRLYKLLYKNIIYPLYHLLKRDGLLSAEKKAKYAEGLSPEELAQYQQKKIIELLKFVFVNVPYYREKLEESGVKDQSEITANHIYSLPVLTKSEIKNNFNKFQSRNLSGNRIFKNSTSGSSGEPFKFNTDLRTARYKSAVVERNHRWAGIYRGDKEARLWGAQIDVSVSDNIRGKIHGFITRKLMLSSYSMTKDDLTRYGLLLSVFKPKLLTSYPGPLEVFAKFCKKKGISFPSLKAIITSAEMLYPHQREEIESAFKVKIFNRYGSREFGAIAQEDKYHNGLRVNSDHVFIEILNEHGKECSQGELGELVITDLDNYGMPLIRYKIGDRAFWSEDQCYYTGMPFPLLGKIEGRSLDVVITPNGNRIGGTYWTILMRSRGNIELFQIKQTALDLIYILYKSMDQLTDIEIDYFNHEIKEKCGDKMNVVFDRVEEIPETSNGKHRIIISEI